MKPIRLFLIDDHVVVRAGLRMLIESRDGLTVVGEAGNRANAVAVVAREKPDIILLDLDMGAGGSALDFLTELQSVVPDARILILTGVRDIEAHEGAVRLGARGIVLKDKAAEDLVKAIEKVHAGELWLDHSLVASVISGMSKSGKAGKLNDEESKMATLTERERQVVSLVGQGLRNKGIADKLFISETTVRHHLTSVFSKLEITSRFELIISLLRQKSSSPFNRQDAKAVKGGSF